MGRKAEDRRVRRTRHGLKAALLDLVEERDFGEITVEEIAERADIGRSTFYTHFTSKEDLLFAGFEDWLQSLTAPPEGRGSERRFWFSLPLLEHISGQPRFFRATIVGGRDSRVRERFTAMLRDLVSSEMDRMAGKGGPSPAGSLQRARAFALASAYLGLVTWWLEEGAPIKMEALDEEFQRLALAQT